ncbi:ATP-grasp domain-containing protein [Candidatus Magnetominusculus xianensis]|uniref:ATP-grasp domain protein n=1 Tax=Candidatus Magnetominusculus xianensis TaxID=1748249 RepID=A0ABR5SHH0_9BACT|nr:ATP-grasp domain-containing protein [Candidatus Magnetominusculus xianensis]KWT91557.1 ATP-grasp domain protein [Candidatus Magnetominusculus xianensis]MBF0404343.1 ATP-grasp domain-containing protein [Nitrospirota bacterium]
MYYAKSIRKIREGGFHTIALDRDPQAQGSVEADEFYHIDIIDVEKVMRCAIDNGIDGIMPLNEFGMRTHAYIANELGLPGVHLDCVEAVVDKSIMRQCWRNERLNQPDFLVFTTKGDAYCAAETIGFPCIIKPADSGGSGRGVIIADNRSDVDNAYDFAKQYARNGKIIAETFIEGIEVTVEGLCQRGEHKVLSISDKYKPDIKTRVATSLNYPAALSETILNAIKALVTRAVKALGLTDCATHTELIVSPEGVPYLIEIGARGGGGHIFSTIVEAVTGINMPLELAKILTGLQPDWIPRVQRGACYRFFNPPKGTIVGIEGLDEAKNIEGVLDIGVTKKIGDKIGELLNSQERVGFIVTSANDRNGAWELANYIERIVNIKVQP